MTDASPGPGWWLASDGRWYPPHLHPDVRARADEPAALEEPAAVEPARTTAFAAPVSYVPDREPIDWERVAAERAARRHAVGSRRRRKVAGATLASIATVGVLFVVARNDGNDDRDIPTSSTEAPATTTTTTIAATTEAPASSLPAGSVSVFSLQPGTCVQNADLLSGPVTTVIAVPCEQPHTHEVYHKVTYTPPDGAYDSARISLFASEQCSQSFATYVGIPYDRSKYYFLNFAPTEESWTQKGDREVVCLLFLQGSELTGSAKATAQ
jgi:hypothetical protein